MKKKLAFLLAMIMSMVSCQIVFAEKEYFKGSASVSGFSLSNGSEAFWYEITDKESYDGSKSFHFQKGSGSVPNSYGILIVYVPVKANTSYKYSMAVKAKSAYDMCSMIGWNYKQDLLPLGSTCDWIYLTFDYENKGGDGSAEFQIVINGAAKDFWLDAVSFCEVLPDGSLGENAIPGGSFEGEGVIKKSSSYSAERAKNKLDSEKTATEAEALEAVSCGYAMPVFEKTSEIKLDGDLSEWSGYSGFFLPSCAEQTVKISEWTDNSDLSGDFKLCYDDDYLYIGGIVTDDKYFDSAEYMWQMDSIQINFGKIGTQDYYGYGLKYSKDGGELACNSGDAEDAKKIKYFTAKPDAKHIVYEAAVPRSILYGGDNEGLTFDLLINDNDGNGRCAYQQWRPGIGEGAGSGKYGEVVFVPTEDEYFGWISSDVSKTIEQNVPVSLPVYLINRSGETKSMKITDSKNTGEIEMPPHSAALYNAEGIAASLGENDLSVTVSDGKTEKKISIRHSAELNVQYYKDEFAKIGSQYIDKIKELMKKCDEQSISYDYEKADLWVLERFQKYGMDDAENGKKPRADYVLSCLKEIGEKTVKALNAYLDGTKSPIKKSSYVTSKPIIDKTTFYAMDDSGNTRPVYFMGYGHFTQAQADIPEFETLGANAIQLEIGPSSVISGESGDGTYSINSAALGWLKSVIASCEKNNVGLNLLLSPHYLPQWFKDKYPEESSMGYYDPSDKMRSMLEAYLRAVIPIIKDSPALTSLCLTNETNVRANKEDTLPYYHDFLNDLFEGDVRKMNEAYGTKYTDFDDVEYPDVETLCYAPEENPDKMPQYVDWLEFNSRYLTDFHKWMADIIHEMAPDIPCGVKIMQEYDNNERAWRRQFVNFGTDPENLGAAMEINGNDANNYYTNHMWGILNKMSYYDLQTSGNEKPVADYEDHVVLDRDRSYGLPYQQNHVAADMWQGAIHSRGISTIWVWERTYNDSSDFSDSILHRPDMLRETNYAMIDVNRLANEIHALETTEKNIGILYSKTARAYSLRSSNSLVAAYEAASYLGERIDFVTEKQAAGGKLSNSDIDILIIPYETHILDGALEGIRDFIASGKKVIIIGEDNIAFNQYNKPFDKELRDYIFSNSRVIPAAANPDTKDTFSSPTLKELWSEIRAVKNEVKDDIPVTITDANTGNVIWGVNYTTAFYNGNLLINICDYDYEGGKVIDVRYNGEKIGTATELRSGAETDCSRISIDPYYPILLSVPQEELPKEKTGSGFFDMKNHWAEYCVKDLADEKVIYGVSGLEFKPDRTITAAEFEALLARVCGKNDDAYKSYLDKQEPITREEMAYLMSRIYEESHEKAEKGDMSAYKDYENAAYKEELAKCVKLGLLKGYDDGTLNPSGTATRAEAAAVILRFRLVMQGINIAPDKADIEMNQQTELKFFDR